MVKLVTAFTTLRLREPFQLQTSIGQLIKRVFDRARFPGYPIESMLTLGRKLALVVVASNDQ